MAANIDELTPEFRSIIIKLLDDLKNMGVEMRPYFTVRDPFRQACLWRQSRSILEIEQKISALRSMNAPFLAHCIESVGPQHGDPVTNAIPGMSWHQWGEAVDCFWVVDGAAEWSVKKNINGVNGYNVFAKNASELKLTPGGFWKSLKDWPHVQLRSDASPLASMPIKEIDLMMRKRFGMIG